MANEGALATLDDESAIAELASGVLSKTIAARYSVTPYAVRKRLAKHPDYPEAIKAQAESFVEDATDEAMRLAEGCDMVAIARARVKLETAHKWAAARDPARWGNKTQLTGAEGQPLQINNISITFVQPAQGNTIEHVVDVGVDAHKLEDQS